MSASVFPARAGMSPMAYINSERSLCVPRASGDEPPNRKEPEMFNLCSPRERG